MIIVFYDKDRNIVDVVRDVINPIVRKNEIKWDGGRISDFNLDFIILDDKAEFGEVVTDDLIAKDKKSYYQERDPEKEAADLRERLENAEMAILSLMNFI